MLASSSDLSVLVQKVLGLLSCDSLERIANWRDTLEDFAFEGRRVFWKERNLDLKPVFEIALGLPSRALRFLEQLCPTLNFLKIPLLLDCRISMGGHATVFIDVICK